MRLDWDSRHFGLPVARAQPEDASGAALEKDLARAREQGIGLLYVFRDSLEPVPKALLDRFGGRAVCTQVEFRKELAPDAGPPAPEGLRVEGVAPGPIPEGLEALAIEAGRTSRFRLDPGIPRAAFEALYRTWCERSVRGELADHVLVARAGSGERVGLVTVAGSGATGRIGLLSVDGRWRRVGVAAALMSVAEARMRGDGRRRSLVVTQLENEEVCRFYASAGYVEAERSRAFHFRPGEAA